MDLSTKGLPRMRLDLRRLLVAALCGAAVIGAGCGSDRDRDSGAASAGGGDGKITLGVSPFQDTLLPLVAERKGFFKDAGIDVQLKTLGWEAIMPAVASGSVDVAINNTTGVISVANREPGVIYWYGWNPFTEGAALIGKKGSALKTVEQLQGQGLDEKTAVRQALQQLKGKTIVTTLSSDMGKAVNSALESVGMTRDDVKIVDLNPDQGLAAFLSGKTGDAYLGGVPQRTKAVKEGFPIIASGPQLAPPPINGFVTKKQFAQANDEDLLKLLDAMFRTIQHCNKNTDECADIIVGELNKTTGGGLTNADFKAFWQKIENYAANPQEVQKAILDPSGYAYWKKTWDGDNAYLVQQEKAIKAPVDAREHFWGEKVQEAYIKRFGENGAGA
jgi:ABC-type nitrate/sulfonate/bicarbonate transport system substrate-binding protein